MKQVIRPLTQSELYTGKSKSYRTSVTNRRNDTVKDFTIKIVDIDKAIRYYFTKVVQQTVTERGKLIKVPIIYGKPARWIMIRKFGYLRDKKNRAIVPLITYRNTSIERNVDISMGKLDANNPQLFYPVMRKWSEKNKYDNFNILNRQSPIYDIYEVAIPEYIILTYEGIIWTNWIEQLNGIIESMLYSEKSYWGEKNKFMFLTKFNGSFSKSEEIPVGQDKTVKSTFSMTVYGHIIPDSINKQLSMKERNQKVFSSFKIIIGEESIVTDINDIK